MENLLSPKALAKVLGISEQTIYNRLSIRGDLPPSLKLGRLVRFRPDDVETWLFKQQKVAVVPLKVKAPMEINRRRGRPTKAEQIAARQKN